MKVYAVIGVNWNAEYGYDEFSKPIDILSDKAVADEMANDMKNRFSSNYEDYIVVPYIIK